jgi:protein tyrosine phosphatase
MGNAGTKPRKDDTKSKSPRPAEKKPQDPKILEWKALAAEDLAKFGQQNDSLFSAALAQQNIEKNRYSSVLAPDESRVKLTKEHGHDSDYINANFVDGVHDGGEKYYIASQAPKPDTIEAFWRMIWDQNVSVVVMLTNLEEHGRVKAHQYWPSTGTKRYGDISLTVVDSSEKKDYHLRNFTIKKGGGPLHQTVAARPQSESLRDKTASGEKRRITQYHFSSWPDHGVPENPDPLLEMMDDVEKEHLEVLKTGSPSPLLVHCSAGIGRTGTYIVVHSVSQKLREEGIDSMEDLSLQPILSRMRDQRPGFVQQRAQYMFCYKAIFKKITGKDTAIGNAAVPLDPNSKALEEEPIAERKTHEEIDA